MPEIKEVHTYDHDSTSTSSALMVVAIVLVLLIVGLVVWQPWAPGRDTTIITQPAPDTTIVNPPSNTTIVNPPADPPKTEINIETPPPPTGGGDSHGSGDN